MGWNYRVLRSEDDGEVCYAIHEVYYKDGKPVTSAKNASGIFSETRSGLFEVIAMMADALDQPILQWIGDQLVEVEFKQELTDDIRRVMKNHKEHFAGMSGRPVPTEPAAPCQ
jgi:hypothetical protein